MNFKIFDTLMDGVVVIDSAEKLVYLNPAAAEIISSSVRRIKLGQSLFDYFNFSSKIWQGKLIDIQSPTPYIEVELVQKNQKKSVLQVSIQPAFDDKVSNQNWILYLKNLTLETSLQAKYVNEKELKSRAVEAATKDSLTQIFNKGALLEKISALSNSVLKNGGTFSMIFFDLDNFKSVNDKYGHQAGDYVLSELTQVINYRMLREGDFFARFGGEEFVIILNRCAIDNATKVAERIRQSVEEHEFIYDDTRLPVTISIGVGEYNNKSGDPDIFFKKVDAAAYESKRKGKNLVSVVAD